MRIHLLAVFLVAALVSPASQAGWANTGFVKFDIKLDNGRTYFIPVLAPGNNLGPTCAYGRLELRDTGDYFNSVENARRMMATLLTAKSQGLRVNFGFEDQDGPACRVSGIQVEWPQ